MTSVPVAFRLIDARLAHYCLLAVLVLVALLSLAIGATHIDLFDALLKLSQGETLTRLERLVLWDIRTPRTALAALVGAALAVSGAVMQGLFRNPLADPGIIGVSSGAGFGATIAIVASGFLPLALQTLAGIWLVPICAFLGALATTLTLYAVATRRGRTSIATMLLAGIALAALYGAGIGVCVYFADDQQLRDVDFWFLGSLGGASWAKLWTTALFIAFPLLLSPMLGRGLNGLALGESTAKHMGIHVQRVKTLSVLSIAMSSGAAVAVAGGIGFVGIVIPHLVRLATGPDHQPLLINVALLGACVLLLADMLARTVLAPAEFPIGIVMALIGAPVFLWILLGRRSLVDL